MDLITLDRTLGFSFTDLFVVGLGYLALKYPVAALVVAGTLLVLIVVLRP